jgi:hypothetical protein
MPRAGRGWAWLLALLLAPLSGCFTVEPEQSITRHDAQLPFAAPDNDDLVVMEIALLECNVNDAYVNGLLWDFVDETDNAERKTLLHDNGFRMGLLGPMPPDRLIDLMTAERNQTNMRQRRLPAGNPAALPVGSTWTQCRYELKRDGQAIPVELDKAQCVLEIVPTATKDGGTTLTFTPLVRHGEIEWLPRPIQDPSGVLRWDLQTQQQASERYRWLSWELSVMPNEYVVVGTDADRTGTLGQRTFLNTESMVPVQRLLVMRVVRAPHAESKMEDQGKRPPPLALQAAWTTIRGNAP